MNQYVSPTQRPIVGIFFLILSTWAISALDAGAKLSMFIGLNLIFFAWIRYGVHTAIVFFLAYRAYGSQVFRPTYRVYQLWRGLLMILASFCFFTTLSYLPQAEATSIIFLAPLMVLCLAPFLLGEAPRLHRWLAALVGVVGVMIVVRPSAGLPWVGVVFGLMAATLIALQFVLTRKVAGDPAVVTLFWSGLVGTVLCTLLLPFFWKSGVAALADFGNFELTVLLSTGVLGALGHLLQIKAYQHATASLLAPFNYLQIVAASTMGFLVWGHFPDAISWFGIAIICLSGVTVTWIEWREGRRAKASAH